MKKPFRCIAVLAAAVISSALPSPGRFKAAAAGYGLETHTPEEIRAFYNAHPWSTSGSTVYDERPSSSAPYALGTVSEQSQQEALNCLNFCRYVAGLPADITAKDSYVQYAQAASLVSAANGGLSHSPSQPADMEDELYKLGKSGAGQCNLGMGYYTLPASLIDGYMEDSDSYNIAMVGHRRWVLNPDMLYSGFGMVGRYSAMYAFDYARSDRFTGDYVAWPAANMPYQLYTVASRYAFSVSLGPSFSYASLDTVTVDVTSQKLGKTYHLDKSNNSDYNYYLNVNTDGYGMSNCIIFYPGVQFDMDDVVSVEIGGLKKSGEAASLSYTVQFFDLYNDEAGNPIVTTTTPEPDKWATYQITDAGMNAGDVLSVAFSKQTGRVSLVNVSYVDENRVHCTSMFGGFEDLLEGPGSSSIAFTAPCALNSITVKMRYTGDLPEISHTVIRQEPETTTAVTTTETTSAATTTTTATTTVADTTTTVPALDPSLLGDVDCNTHVNIADVVLLAQYNAEIDGTFVSAQGLVNADCNCDGSVDSDDASELLTYIAGLPSEHF